MPELLRVVHIVDTMAESVSAYYMEHTETHGTVAWIYSTPFQA